MVRTWQKVQGLTEPETCFVRDGNIQVITKNHEFIEKEDSAIWQWDEYAMPVDAYNEIVAGVSEQTEEAIFEMAQMVDENSQAIMELAEMIGGE